MKKLNEGTLKNLNPFMDEPQAWLSGEMSANSNMGAPESSQHHQELGRHKSSPSFVGTSSSSNYFGRMNSPFAFGTNSVLSTQSVQHIEKLGNSSAARFRASWSWFEPARRCCAQCRMWADLSILASPMQYQVVTWVPRVAQGRLGQRCLPSLSSCPPLFPCRATTGSPCGSNEGGGGLIFPTLSS